jgi:transcriptional regulator with XRE-family HTH domain
MIAVSVKIGVGMGLGFPLRRGSDERCVDIVPRATIHGGSEERPVPVLRGGLRLARARYVEHPVTQPAAEAPLPCHPEHPVNRSTQEGAHAPLSASGRDTRCSMALRRLGPRADKPQIRDALHHRLVGAQETAVQRGRRLGRSQCRRAGEELRVARAGSGLSQRTLASMSGRSHATIGRIERGATRTLDIMFLATVAAIVGLDLRVSLFPSGSPVRDAAHLALISRFRARVSALLRWRTEVPMPITGDLRSADVVIDGPEIDAMVEAETRLDDLQALDRRLATKQRDLGSTRLILLVADTRHNRAVLAAHPEFRARFPVSTRACLMALAEARDPGGDALVVL